MRMKVGEREKKEEHLIMHQSKKLQTNTKLIRAKIFQMILIEVDFSFIEHTDGKIKVGIHKRFTIWHVFSLLLLVKPFLYAFRKIKLKNNKQNNLHQTHTC